MFRMFANCILFPTALIAVTFAVQVLICIGKSESLTVTNFPLIFGNTFAWTLLFGIFTWAWLWLWASGETYSGPTTTFGYTPIYKANGKKYYFCTLIILISIILVNPRYCSDVYENAGALLGALNVSAILLSLFLYIRSKMKSEPEIDPYLLSTKDYLFVHEFYRGMDLHPRYLGVDAKQFIVVRIGLMLWQLLVVIYFGSSFQRHGLDAGQAVSAVLQSVYLYQFFASETSYFSTLDITLDRMGFYLCWGSLVGFPALYVFPTFYFVEHNTACSPGIALIIYVIGLAAIYFRYEVDSQKEVFRESEEKYLKIWKKKPEFVRAEYCLNDGSNSTRKTKLIVSGWWRIGRKINYSFELLSAFVWCSPAGYSYGVWPYIYFIFLLLLLLHRIHRDELKCRTKYGKSWDAYCKIVPYRLIPGIY